MCGFVAVISSHSTLESSDLQIMQSLIKHRGPSSSKTSQFNVGNTRISLAFNRLSILDQSDSADQPFTSNCGRYTIVFNGEIYNYKQLKHNLMARYTFETSSDTEVLLAAYLAYGNDVCSQIEGMYAFLIIDHNLERYFIARDPFGEKPLYYSKPDEDTIIFSSEQKPILAYPGVTAKPNLAILSHAVQNLLTIPNNSIFLNISSYPAGHFSSESLRNLSPIHKRYFNPVLPSCARLKLSEAVCNRIYDALIASFEEKYQSSDVPVGLLLSGGLDSSTLYTYLANKYSIPIFSVVYPGMESDESQAIADLLGHSPSPSNTFFLSPSYSDLIDQLQLMHWHFETLVPGPSMFLEWEIYRLSASIGIPVLLDGQGADELFAGYSEHLYWHQKSYPNKSHRLEERPSPAPVSRIAQASTDFYNYYIHDIENFSLPINLYYGDRSSMAHGIELRHPYISSVLFNEILMLDSKALIQKDSTKYLLRMFASKFGLSTPSIISNKKKIGFEMPRKILSTDKDFLHYIYEQLGSGIIQDYFPATSNHIEHLMSLISPTSLSALFDSYWYYLSLANIMQLFDKNSWCHLPSK